MKEAYIWLLVAATAVVVLAFVLAGMAYRCTPMSPPTMIEGPRACVKANVDVTENEVVQEVVTLTGCETSAYVMVDGATSMEDEVDRDDNECSNDGDCDGESTCELGGIYYFSRSAVDIPHMNLAGEATERLDLPLLTQNHLNVSDLQTYERDGIRFLIVTTGTKRLLLHRPGKSILITTNVAATDLAVCGDRAYVVASGRLYYAHLPRVLHAAHWDFRGMDAIRDRVLSITCPSDGTVLAVGTATGTYFVRRGRVVRHELSTAPRTYGKTEAVLAVQNAQGSVDVYPNKERVAVEGPTVITEDNRMFTLAADRNQWLKRLRTLESEPVLVGRGVCTVKTDEAGTRRVQ